MFRDCSQDPASCNSCDWRGVAGDLKSKDIILTYRNPETGQLEGDIDSEPCCPKCGSTNINWGE